jgi:hypothetical protein
MTAQLVPGAPVDSAIDSSTQTAVTSVMAVFAVAALVFSLVHLRRTGRPTVLLLWLSGGAMMLMEPMIDTVGACWFPARDSWVVFTLWGRPLPAWLCLCYFFYFGVGVSVTWLLMKRGLTRTQLWVLFAGSMVGDAVMEIILLQADTYIYYGHQPLILAKFPLWWAPVNSLITMVAAALVYRFEHELVGRRLLLIIPIAVSASAAVNAVAGWPSWLVINSDLGDVATQAGGLATFALSFWCMSLVVRAIAAPAAGPAPSGPVTARLGPPAPAVLR